MAGNQTPRIGVELFVDTSKYDKQISAALNDAEKLDKELKKLSAETIDVKVNIDTSEVGTAQTAIADLAEDQTLKVNVDDSELAFATRAIADIDTATPEVKVNADDQEVQEVKDLLEQIRTLSVVNVALNVPSTLTGLVDTLANLPGVGQVLGNQRAEGLLSIPTGEFNPEDLALAQQLYTDAFFESTEEAAVFINQLKSIGVEADQLNEAAYGALAARDAFTAMGQDADLAQIAVAQNALVLNDLAENATEASDIIAAGVVGGANRRDDFLDSLIEYSSTFSNFGATADEVLSLFNSGLEAGFDNTDRVADLFREFQIRVSNPEETAAQESLANLGLGDEAAAFQAGELTGVEFFNGVISAIQGMNDQTQAGEQQAALANIFGTQTEDFMGSVFGLDPTQLTFDQIEGRATEISTLLNDNLGVAFTELFNTINVEAGNLLSSDAIDLDGKLEAIKTAVQTTVDEIQAGSTLSEAIKVGLEPLGFDDEFTKLEGVFGNFIIQFLEVIAGLQELLGKDATSTREEIARLGAQQLEFDLQVANADEVTDLISQAMARGVDPETIGQIASTAVNSAIDAGNIAQAQNIVTGAGQATTTVTGGQGAGILGGLTSLFAPGTNVPIEVPVELGINATALQQEIDTASAVIAQSVSRAAEDDVSTLVTPITERAGSAQATAAGDDTSTQLTTAQDIADASSALAGAAVTAQDATEAAAAASALSSQEFVNAVAQMQTGASLMDDTISRNAESAGESMQGLGDTITEVTSGNTITEDFALIKTTADENFPTVIDYIDTLRIAFTEMGNAASVSGVQASSAISGLGTTASNAGDPFQPDQFASGGIANGTFIAGEEGAELITTDTSLAVLNNKTTSAIMGAVTGAAQAGVVNNYYYSTNVTNNIQNMAQAAAVGNQISKAVRGVQ